MLLRDRPLNEREARIADIERVVVSMMKDRRPEPLTDLIDAVASAQGWSEAEVAVAVSRLGAKRQLPTATRS